MGGVPCLIDLTGSSDEDEDDDLTILPEAPADHAQRSGKRSHSAMSLGAGDKAEARAEKLNKTGPDHVSQKSSENKSFSDDDCCILDSDPSKVEIEKKTVGTNAEEEDLMVVGATGMIVACRDYPHSRHTCVEHPFKSSRHEIHCPQCHCYVCEERAPCAHWGLGNKSTDHCHASDKADEKWKVLRNKWRDSAARKSHPSSLPAVHSGNLPVGNISGTCPPAVFNPLPPVPYPTFPTHMFMNTGPALGNSRAASPTIDEFLGLQRPPNQAPVPEANLQRNGHPAPQGTSFNLNIYFPPKEARPVDVNGMTAHRNGAGVPSRPTTTFRPIRPSPLCGSLPHSSVQNSQVNTGNFQAGLNQPGSHQQQAQLHKRQLLQQHLIQLQQLQQLQQHQRQLQHRKGPRTNSPTHGQDPEAQRRKPHSAVPAPGGGSRRKPHRAGCPARIDISTSNMGPPIQPLSVGSHILHPQMPSHVQHDTSQLQHMTSQGQQMENQVRNSNLNPFADPYVPLHRAGVQAGAHLGGDVRLVTPTPSQYIPSTLAESFQQVNVQHNVSTSMCQGLATLISFSELLSEGEMFRQQDQFYGTGGSGDRSEAGCTEVDASRGRDHPNCTDNRHNDSAENPNEKRSLADTLLPYSTAELFEKMNSELQPPQLSQSMGERNTRRQTEMVGVTGRNVEESSDPTLLVDYCLGVGGSSDFWADFAHELA